MFPKQKEILDPLLSFILLNGGPNHEVHTAEIYEPMAHVFALTEAERSQPKNDGQGKQWEWMLQWARQALINRGFAEKSDHGVWRLTQSGVCRAEEYNSLSTNDVSVANTPYPLTRR
jgi:restriction endonuclease Mrr